MAGYTQPLTCGAQGHGGSHTSAWAHGHVLPRRGRCSPATARGAHGGEDSVPAHTREWCLRALLAEGYAMVAAPLAKSHRILIGDKQPRRPAASSNKPRLRNTLERKEGTGRSASSPSTRADARRGRRSSRTVVSKLDVRRPELGKMWTTSSIWGTRARFLGRR